MQDPQFDKTFQALEARGSLTQAHNTLPSVSMLILEEPVKGTWWGHPKGRAMTQVCTKLEAHADVVMIPLIIGENVYVHRKLWPALLGVALARRPWQIDGISKGARLLLQSVEDGSLDRSNDKESVDELERRLLLRTESLKSTVGPPQKRLETWRQFMLRKGLEGPFPPAAEAEALIEAAYAGFECRFPWKS